MADCCFYRSNGEISRLRLNKLEIVDVLRHIKICAIMYVTYIIMKKH